MNWGFRNILVQNKALIDDGSEIHAASDGAPVRPIYANELGPHYGGRAWSGANAPADYAGFDPHIGSRNEWRPTDTLSFGGYHGGNFLERDAKNSTWKHQ